MALEESGEQLSLQENQFICTQLDYPGIATHLIQAGIITQEQNAQIQEAFVDNAGRMQELISILVKLNSETSFDAFREAVKEVGEILLAQKLLRDQYSLRNPRNAPDAHPCLFIPHVLSQILSYLTYYDLSTARLVCKTWNAVIAACHMQKFTAKFPIYTGHKQMVEFVSTGSKSVFCKRLNRFSFEIGIMMPRSWVFYKAFFVKFGSQIEYLRIAPSLDKDLLAFIFSPEIKECLKNLTHLELFVIPDEGLISTADSLTFLSGLETLFLTGSCTKGIHFLEHFLESNQSLKVLQLGFGTSKKGFPNESTILPKLSALEELTLDTQLADTTLGLMTIPNGEGRLKVIHFKLGNVSPGVFRDFIASHRHTLRRINITIYSCDNLISLMEGLPGLENLKYLNLYGDHSGGRFGDSISSLQFCTRAPNLKFLRVHRLGTQMTSQPVPQQPTFVHVGLKELMLYFDYENSKADEVRGFLSHVPQYFPNLMKLDVFALNVDWPVQLEHLQLQPGYRSCDYLMAEWKSTRT